MNAQSLRILLLVFFIAIFLLSVSYLRRRKMSAWEYAFWGTFALLLPAFGPFFVIAYRPGEPRRKVWGYRSKKAAKRYRISKLT